MLIILSGAKDIDAAHAQDLIIALIAKIGILNTHLGSLTPSNDVLGSITKHALALRIKALIFIVLDAILKVVIKLNIKIVGLAARDGADFSGLLIKVAASIQAVLDLCVKLVAGLDVELVAVLDPIVSICARLGIHLHVGKLAL